MRKVTSAEELCCKRKGEVLNVKKSSVWSCTAARKSIDWKERITLHVVHAFSHHFGSISLEKRIYRVSSVIESGRLHVVIWTYHCRRKQNYSSLADRWNAVKTRCNGGGRARSTLWWRLWTMWSYWKVGWNSILFICCLRLYRSRFKRVQTIVAVVKKSKKSVTLPQIALLGWHFKSHAWNKADLWRKSTREESSWKENILSTKQKFDHTRLS